MFDSINGCVSTGKEANVYHATAGTRHVHPTAAGAQHAQSANPTAAGVSAAAGEATAATGEAAPDSIAHHVADVHNAHNDDAHDDAHEPTHDNDNDDNDAADDNPEAPPGDLAVKVYKTSILVFKDRDRCVV